MSPVDPDEIDRESLEQDLQDLKNMIDNFKALGVNVEAVETILTQSLKSLNADNIVLANTLLESAKETYKLIKQQYFIQASSILFSSLQRTILELEGAGSEVNYIKDLYNKAKEMFDSGDYEDAMGYIKSAEDMAADLRAGMKATIKDEVIDEDLDRSQEQMERVSKILIRVEDLLQKAIDNGYSVNEAEKLYSLAEDAFDYQDYEKAKIYALDAEKSLKEILEPSFLNGEEEVGDEGESDTQIPIREDIPLGNGVSGKKRTYSDIMPMGIIGDAPGKSEPNETELTSKDFPEKPTAFKRSKTSIDDLKADLQRIMERVPTKRIVKKPREFEKEPVKIEPSTQTTPKDKDDEESIKLKEDEDKLSKKVKTEPTPKKIEPATVVEDDFEKRINKKLKIEEKPIPEVPKLEVKAESKEDSEAEFFDSELDVKGSPEDQATALMKLLERKIKKAKLIKLNVPMAERLYSIAESYFEDSEFKSVVEYTKKGIKNVNEQAIRKGLAPELGLRQKGEVIDDVKEKRIQGKEEQELTVEEEEPVEVEALEPEPPKKKKKITNKKAAAKIKAALKKIQKEIKETKDMGVPVDQAENFIKNAIRELMADNLVNAKELGIDAKNTLKLIKSDFIKQKALDMIKVAWKEISDAQEQGIDVSVPYSLLEKARQKIKEEEFDKAAQFAMKAINFFK